MSHYLSTVCDGCQCVSLTALSSFASGSQPCAKCGDALRVVPSCSYKQSALGLFTELSQVVADGGVDPDEAQALTTEIVHALATGALKECSELLLMRLPGLLPFQLVTGGNLAEHRATLQALKTIFEALATVRRRGATRGKGVRLPATRFA